MPTLVNPTEKTDFIALVAVINPYEATLLPTILIYYEDIPTVVGRQLDAFSSNNAYLTQCMSVFDSGQMLAAGIQFAQIGVPTPVLDPTLIVNSTFLDGVVFTGDSIGIGVLGTSEINVVTVDTGITLSNLYIGAGSKVDLLDSSAAGAYVSNVFVKFQKSVAGTLLAIKEGSGTGNIIVDPGAVYGGVKTDAPTSACANPVTNLQTTSPPVTHNTAYLTWDVPASPYLLIQAYYRISKSEADWVPGTDQNGFYLNEDTGFAFNKLQADTFYDFQVRVTCPDGGIATTDVFEVQTNSVTVVE